jgi:hypothetical protein
MSSLPGSEERTGSINALDDILPAATAPRNGPREEELAGATDDVARPLHRHRARHSGFRYGPSIRRQVWLVPLRASADAMFRSVRFPSSPNCRVISLYSGSESETHVMLS